MSKNTPQLMASMLALVILAVAHSLCGAEPAPPESPIKRIYIIHFSHTDVGFTDMPGVCREMQCRYLDIAIDGVLASMSKPADQRIALDVRVAADGGRLVAGGLARAT